MIAAALTFSCQKAELENNDVVDNGTNNEVVDFVPGPGKILAVSPTGTETKIAFGDAVDGKYPVVWTNNDAIKVYSENSAAGEKYTFEGDNASSAVFTGNPVEGTTRYAVFPETRAYGLEEGKLKISFGALKKQDYHTSVQANGSNLKYMPMWAKEGEGDDTGKFVFNNLCGVVSFRFNDYQELRGMKITSVKITSASKYISGVATLDPADGSFTLAAENEDTPDADKEIVVSREVGLAIANTNTSPSIEDPGVKGYLIALPAGEYPAGDLTVTMTDSFGRVFTRTVNSLLRVLPGVDKTFKTLSFTFAYGEANSIVVNPKTPIEFNIGAKYSFSTDLSVEKMIDVKDAAGKTYNLDSLSVSVLWQIEESGTTKDGDLITVGGISDNKVTITPKGKKGNALVALKDTKGVILWSWHVWVVDGLTDQTYTALSTKGSPTFMDRNLGATATAAGNMNTVGLYYQYGRKDPFVISKDFTPTKDTSTPKWLSQVELTAYTTRTTSNATMSWSIKNPDTRINCTTSITNTDQAWKKGLGRWLSSMAEVEKNWGAPTTDKTLDQANTVSGGYKTIYDPCPAGYRVPEFYYYAGLSKDTNTTLSSDSNGYDVMYDGENTTHYPFSGTLNAATYNSVQGGVIYYGNRGMYWTTTLLKNGDDLGAAGVFYNGTYLYATSMNRLMFYGMAANIRCLKIQ